MTMIVALHQKQWLRIAQSLCCLYININPKWMKVYCCCSIAHQPSSAGEKALFTSVTAAMSKTVRTRKWLRKWLDRCYPHSASVHNTFRTIVDVGSGTSLEIFHHPRRHCGPPCFVAHRLIMTGWILLAQPGSTRAIVRITCDTRENRGSIEGQRNLVCSTVSRVSHEIIHSSYHSCSYHQACCPIVVLNCTYENARRDLGIVAS
jgi:hypothetical protein